MTARSSPRRCAEASVCKQQQGDHDESPPMPKADEKRTNRETSGEADSPVVTPTRRPRVGRCFGAAAQHEAREDASMSRTRCRKRRTEKCRTAMTPMMLVGTAADRKRQHQFRIDPSRAPKADR